MTQSPERRQSSVKPRRFWLRVVGIVSTLAVVVCCIGGVALLAKIFQWQPTGTPQIVVVLTPTVVPTMASPQTLADASEACGSEGQLTSLNYVLNIDTSKGATRAFVNCLLGWLDAPSSLYDEINSTVPGESRVDKWGSEGPAGTATFSITWHVDDKGYWYVSIIDNRQGVIDT
jgi:hypothetical protein